MLGLVGGHLEVSRALDGEDEEDNAAVDEGSAELGLVAGRGRPDPPLLRELNVPQVAALHDEVAHRREGRPRGRCLGALQEGSQGWIKIRTREPMERPCELMGSDYCICWIKSPTNSVLYNQ